jgi:3-oxoacyl-[acyl-carrier protein] reductase
LRRLEGKAVLVTGSGRGIGRAMALAFARAGARVGLCARSEGGISEVAAMIAESGGEAAAVCGDVAEVDDARRIAAGVAGALGPIDVLVNNAGIFRVSPLLETRPEDLDAIIRTNVRGPYLMAQAVLPAMVERRSGTIINVASMAGKKGYAGQSAYCASKHALLGLTKSLALEMREHNVRVVALSPGGVDTEMIATARPDIDRGTWMDADDVAELAVLLAALPPKVEIDEIAVRRSAAMPEFL